MAYNNASRHRFSAISGLAFFLAWLTIIACNFRFRAALKAQNDDTLDRRFAFKQPLYPWLQILAFTMILFMVICQFIVSVWPIGDVPSAKNFFSEFISVPIFLVMWAGYKLIYRTGWKKLVSYIWLFSKCLWRQHGLLISPILSCTAHVYQPCSIVSINFDTRLFDDLCEADNALLNPVRSRPPNRPPHRRP